MDVEDGSAILLPFFCWYVDHTVFVKQLRLTLVGEFASSDQDVPIEQERGRVVKKETSQFASRDPGAGGGTDRS